MQRGAGGGQGPGKGRSAAGKGPGKGRPKSKVDPVQVKAREIMDQTGLPLSAAVEVARGKWTMEHAFNEVRTKAEMHRLHREHDISMSLAGQVVRGQLGLDAAIFCSKMSSDDRVRGGSSILQEAHSKGETLSIVLLGGQRLQGKIVENTPFSMSFGPEGGEAVSLQKHELALVCGAAVGAEVQGLLSRDESVAALGLRGTGKVGERLKVKDRDLYPFLMADVPVVVTLRDGTRFAGVVKWFGRWELGIELGGVGEIVTFRHALYGIEPVAQ